MMALCGPCSLVFVEEFGNDHATFTLIMEEIMDPNALLEQLLNLTEATQNSYDEEDGNGIDQDDANELAEKVTQLDKWLRFGGFLPKRWERTDIKKQLDAVADELHPHRPKGGRHGYVPAQLPGMVRRLQEELAKAKEELAKAKEELAGLRLYGPVLGGK